MAETLVSTAKNVRCAVCRRKLCKLKDFEMGRFVEIKHRGAFALASEVIVGCEACKTNYRVCADSDLIEDIEIGREL